MKTLKLLIILVILILGGFIAVNYFSVRKLHITAVCPPTLEKICLRAATNLVQIQQNEMTCVTYMDKNIVQVKFNPTATKKIHSITKNNVGKLMAVLAYNNRLVMFITDDYPPVLQHDPYLLSLAGLSEFMPMHFYSSQINIHPFAYLIKYSLDAFGLFVF